jgi:hypothetical protein
MGYDIAEFLPENERTHGLKGEICRKEDTIKKRRKSTQFYKFLT